MKRALIVRREAEADIDQAFAWYESQRPGLGHDFLLCVEAAMDTITLRPFSFPVVRSPARRAITRRFPYLIFFIVSDDTISVIAVLHGSRNPRRWIERLSREGGDQ